MTLQEVNIETILSLGIDRFIVNSGANGVLEEVRLIENRVYFWDAWHEEWIDDSEDSLIKKYMHYFKNNKLYIKQ